MNAFLDLCNKVVRASKFMFGTAKTLKHVQQHFASGCVSALHKYAPFCLQRTCELVVPILLRCGACSRSNVASHRKMQHFAKCYVVSYCDARICSIFKNAPHGCFGPSMRPRGVAQSCRTRRAPRHSLGRRRYTASRRRATRSERGITSFSE